MIEAISLLSLPGGWQSKALLRAQTLVEQTQPGQIDRPALEARLKRLGRLYQDGLITDEQYERDRDSLREQLSAAPAALPVTDMRAVAALLGDFPTIVKEATTEERRAILVQLVDQVYLRHDALLAIRPTLRAWPLLQAVYGEFLQVVGRWAGWGSNPRHSA